MTKVTKTSVTLSVMAANGDKSMDEVVPMKSAGITQSWDRTFQIWGSKFYSGQSITIKEQACRAAADVFKRYGFNVGVGSRLD